MTNNGEYPVTGTTLVDALPSGAQLVSAPGCTGSSVLSCVLGTLAPGASAAVGIHRRRAPAS